jgi:hypothetical protein
MGCNEPDPDDLTRAQLAESDPLLYDVALALDDWLHFNHGVLSSHHNAGHFWTLLHERGVGLVREDPPDFEPLLPPSTD